MTYANYLQKKYRLFVHSRKKQYFCSMKIGVFDSGYGGLTILEQIRKRLPQYDYIYLGDNARAPYGTHSFDVIYQYTWQAVQYLFRQDCSLVVLACNTASAKALRTIQQKDLPLIPQHGKRDRIPNVLGVIRPTVEDVAQRTRNGHIGVVGTTGTIQSESYLMELRKQRESLRITQQACPMWVPLIENGEHLHQGADYFVDKYLRLLFAQDPDIDTLILGCTHYPMLLPKIESTLGNITSKRVEIIAQGSIVAQSLQDYLQRHTELRDTLSTGGGCRYMTTESVGKFREAATVFLQAPVEAEHIRL